MKYCFLILIALTGASCVGQTQSDLSVEQFESAVSNKDAQLVDVRTPEEYNDGFISGAVNYDWNGGDFDEQARTLDQSKPVYVYCLSGGRSSNAAARLREMGFDEVYNMSGGIMAWRNAKKPLVRPNDQPEKVTSSSISVNEYYQRVKSDKLILVDFYAPWCAPCKKMEPFLNEIGVEKEKTVDIVRINADENKAVVEELRVDGLPTILLYKNGELVFRKTGFMSKSELLNMVAKY